MIQLDCRLAHLPSNTTRMGIQSLQAAFLHTKQFWQQQLCCCGSVVPLNLRQDVSHEQLRQHFYLGVSRSLRVCQFTNLSQHVLLLLPLLLQQQLLKMHKVLHMINFESFDLESGCLY